MSQVDGSRPGRSRTPAAGRGASAAPARHPVKVSSIEFSASSTSWRRPAGALVCGDGSALTFVLVPGACHGGWWYDPLVAAIEPDGHRARAVTLAGLEDEPRLDRVITLRTHVEQVAAAVPADGDVVLVGHSYAGSVITGVADRMPRRISALVYLDAFLPEDGDSCWSLTDDEQRQWYVGGCAATGYGVDPLPFFDQRARPHPIATLLQAAALSGAWRDVPVRHYVAARWPGESPMAVSIARAEADPRFVVHHWESRHNVLANGPDLVLGLLRELPGYLPRG